MILKIGNHKVELQSKITTLKKVKTVVNSYFNLFNLDKKDTVIVLPNGTKLKYADLNTIKAFARVIFPAQYLDGAETDENKTFLENITKIQGVMYSLQIDWDLVGTKDGKQILGLYKNANKKAIELEILDPETKLIG